MSRTIVTENDIVDERYIGAMPAGEATGGGLTRGLTGAVGDSNADYSGYLTSDFLGGPFDDYPSTLNVERAREKEADLRAEIEKASQQGDEDRAAVLREARVELLKGLTQREMQDVYDQVEDPSTDILQTEGGTLTDVPETEPPPSFFASQSSSPPAGVDGYTSRLLKYIPAESVALYLTLQGRLLSVGQERPPSLWLWIVFGVGIVGTPLYLARVAGINKPMQLTISTVAFGVWVFALGGAFASLPWYEPFIGSLVLVVFTFFAPLVDPGTANNSGPLASP